MSVDACGNSATVSQTNLVQPNPVRLLSGLTNVTVCANTPVMMCVSVVESCGLTFIWFKDGIAVSGATNACLNIGEATANADYCVRIANGCDAITNCARVTLAEVVSASGPTNLTRGIGQSATFNTVASGGGPVRYQWGRNGTPLAGQTNSALIINPVGANDAGTYFVEVTGACGSVTNSAMLSLSSSEPVLDCLVSHWKFDETGGLTALDFIGTNHGTLVNGPARGPGKIGTAMKFDGVNDLVNVPGSPSLQFSNRFSISVWFNPTRTLNGSSGRQDLMKKFLSYWLILNYPNTDGRLAFLLNSGTPIVKSTTISWASNQWHHVVCVYDGATIRMYVNGVLEGSAAAGVPVVVNTQPLQLGGNSDQGFYYRGAMDEVRLFCTNLSAAAVSALYNENVVAPPPVIIRIVPGPGAGQSTLTWDSLAGTHYAIQYKDELDAPSWTSVPGEVVASGATTSLIISTAAAAHRFYRVITLP